MPCACVTTESAESWRREGTGSGSPALKLQSWDSSRTIWAAGLTITALRLTLNRAMACRGHLRWNSASPGSFPSSPVTSPYFHSQHTLAPLVPAQFTTFDSLPYP